MEGVAKTTLEGFRRVFPRLCASAQKMLADEQALLNDLKVDPVQSSRFL